MASIEIQDKGFYTTIQDRGRLGYARLGVPESGAMDQQALRLSNLLLNNSDQAAALECTLIGPTIRFIKDIAFVLTGALTASRLDNDFITLNKVYLAKKGQVLVVGKVIKGCRVYVGLDGGIDTASYMGSKSLFYPITPKATITDKTTIQTGIPNFGGAKGVHLQTSKFRSLLDTDRIGVLKGPEFDLLEDTSMQQFSNSSLTIHSWNRMGISVAPVIQVHSQLMFTGPVIPGTVQLTPSGRLFILMRDCQTTGGYPRVLQLTPEAINTLAQKKTGDNIKIELQ